MHRQRGLAHSALRVRHDDDHDLMASMIAGEVASTICSTLESMAGSSRADIQAIVLSRIHAAVTVSLIATSHDCLLDGLLTSSLARQRYRQQAS